MPDTVTYRWLKRKLLPETWLYPPARKTLSLQGMDIRAQIFKELDNDILRYMTLSTSNSLENKRDMQTAGQAGLACVNANRIGGRQQNPVRARVSKPGGTREEVLPLAV